MEERFESTLWVNNDPVELNDFVEKFLAKIVIGAASSLRGVADVQNLELNMERGDINVIVNGKEISLTSFPNDIIASTLIGLVSSLKGVDKVEVLKINVSVL
jgi:hypothetical protein